MIFSAVSKLNVERRLAVILTCLLSRVSSLKIPTFNKIKKNQLLRPNYWARYIEYEIEF